MLLVKEFLNFWISQLEIIERNNAEELLVKKGKVVFKNVSLSYNKENIVLDNISLTLEPNSITALVGPSGSGKTSTLNLIPRFYDPLNGEILIDGMSTKDVTLYSLRSSVALVSQEPILFDLSIRDNICLWKERLLAKRK